jgi:hypothetical protein
LRLRDVGLAQQRAEAFLRLVVDVALLVLVMRVRDAERQSDLDRPVTCDDRMGHHIDHLRRQPVDRVAVAPFETDHGDELVAAQPRQRRSNGHLGR